MAPETRSRGVAPPSRVYHSSPVLQQVQFPSRRKKVRTYGRQTSDRLRQQTLTQIDFVSSFDDDDDDGVIVLTDSEDEGRDKENRNPEPPARDHSKRDKESCATEDKGSEHEDDEPAPLRRRNGGGRKRPVPEPTNKGAKGKRRRTLGDETEMSKADDDKSSRRRTMGDSPATSKFHTQTLTQFLGHRSLIADSDDDADDGLATGSDLDQDNGFLDWLGEQGSPSLGRSKTATRLSPSHNARSTVPASRREASASAHSREESVIPQTPVKRVPAIRFAVPLEDVSGGLASKMRRYGPPDMLTSPLKDRSSPAARLPLELTGTPRHLAATPTRHRTAAETPAKSHRETPSPRKKATSPEKADKGLEEIPDSDDEDSSFEQESEQGDDDGGRHEGDHCYGAGAETQLAMHALASSEEELLLDRPRLGLVQPSSAQSPKPQPTSSPVPETTGSISTTLSEPPSPGSQPAPTPSRLARPKPKPAKPIRKPLYHPPSSPLQSQPLESQRVPISILQSLPPHTARSDILLPVGAPSLAALLGGHQVHVHTPSKIPDQVVRFWLLDGALLRYMACVELPGEAARDGGGNDVWQYYVKQVYELNNPVDEDDMREEGWVNGSVAKYVYLPPAVVGQLLWNLRHALFRDQEAQQDDADEVDEEQGAGEVEGDDGLPRVDGGGARQRQQRRLARCEMPAADGMTVSQQVAAQIRSDIAHSTQFIPSTQDDDDDSLVNAEEHPPPVSAPRQPPPSSSPNFNAAASVTASPHLPPPPPPPPRARLPTKHLPRLSQATTASQPSTPEKPQQHSLGSASLLALLDHHHDAAVPLPSSTPSVPASQLLSRSQLLSESLVRDHTPPPPPPEIWDSDDDDVPL
ncbi:uncharacterized protein HRG_10284 [Hirsutella rhossiliensis]|uniref:Uncharacterized protein n=1 Tax=Hirsutella rhossiliensis TaxID=111463 RepID=A0A9P8MPA6_9HYPO|nr:uncharacterized protein HRG_10284 [Hirsutella rhossiliensis]KAH0958597.1 hypothetical protein HRG_10284 [Hirsutella rhossiliensis]